MLHLNTRRNAGARRVNRRLLLVVASLVGVIGLYGMSALPAHAADAEVDIDNFAFKPDALTVKAGTAVVFRNRDDIPHSVVGAEGEFHSKALDTDDSFAFTFAKPGTYAYFCGLHPKMKGEIVVTP